MPARCRAQRATHGAWVRECMELASATGSQVNDDDRIEGGVMQATSTSFLSRRAFVACADAAMQGHDGTAGAAPTDACPPKTKLTIVHAQHMPPSARVV